MFPYRLREPVGEQSQSQSQVPSNSTGNPNKRTRAKISKTRQNREGGALERAIRADMRDFQRLYLQKLNDVKQSNQDDIYYGYEHGFLHHKNTNKGNHWSAGMSFSRFIDIVYHNLHFDRVFQLRKSSGVIPILCHEDGFVQIVYSVCLHLLADALFIGKDNYTTCAGVNKVLFPDQVAFLIFMLYSLYHTYPRDRVRDLIEEAQQCTDEKEARHKWLKLLLPLNLRHDHVDSMFHRRAFRAPIRISQAQFVILQRVRDLALEKMSVCEMDRMKAFNDSSVYDNMASTSKCNINWCCNCSGARDTLEIIDLLQHDEVFELCEYSGPGTLEGFAGNDPAILQSTSNAAMRPFSFSGTGISNKKSNSSPNIRDVIDIDSMTLKVSSYLDSLNIINPTNFHKQQQSITSGSRQSVMIGKMLSPLQTEETKLELQLSLDYLSDICEKSKSRKRIPFPIETVTDREKRRQLLKKKDDKRNDGRFGRRFGLKERMLHAGINYQHSVESNGDKAIGNNGRIESNITDLTKNKSQDALLPSFIKLNECLTLQEKSSITEALVNLIVPGPESETKFPSLINQMKPEEISEFIDDSQLVSKAVKRKNKLYKSKKNDARDDRSESSISATFPEIGSLASVPLEGNSALKELLHTVHTQKNLIGKESRQQKFETNTFNDEMGEASVPVNISEVLSQVSIPLEGDLALGELLQQVQNQKMFKKGNNIEAENERHSTINDIDEIYLPMAMSEAISLASVPLKGYSAINELLQQVENHKKPTKMRSKQKVMNSVSSHARDIDESNRLTSMSEAMSLASTPSEGNLALDKLSQKVRKKRRSTTQRVENNVLDKRKGESNVPMTMTEAMSLASTPLEGNSALDELFQQVEKHSNSKKIKGREIPTDPTSHENVYKPSSPMTVPDASSLGSVLFKANSIPGTSKNDVFYSTKTEAISLASMPLEGNSALDELFQQVKKYSNPNR